MSRPSVDRIAAGGSHSCVLTSDGVLLAWWSADPDLVAFEVGGVLAGLRVVDIAAGRGEGLECGIMRVCLCGSVAPVARLLRL